MVSTGLLDALLQGLVTGSIIAAAALSLSLVYSIAEVPNFAHGDMITVGAYLVLALNAPSAIPFVPAFGGLPLVVSALVGLVLAGGLGVAYERVVFRKFRERGPDLITMVIVSLGLALVLRNAVLFLVGSKNIRYDTDRITNTNVDLYLTDAGLTVQATQRQAGDIATLDAWGYAWPVLGVVLLAAVAVAVGVYRWRRGDGDFREVQLVSPRVVAVVAGVAVVAVGALALRSDSLGTTAVWSTRVGVSVKYGVVLAVAAVVMLGMNVLLKATKTGTAMRATADNMSLAEVRGVDIGRVQLVVWVLAAVLTALAGVLTGWFASNLNPNMGFTLLLPVFAAVILGGITSPYGAVAGSLIIGVSMDVGIYLLPPQFSTYRTAIAFVILIAVLLVRPEGIWGDA